MKVNIIKDDPKDFVVEFEGADRGLAELIKSKLLESKDVDFAAVVKEHPELGWPRLVVKTSKNAKTLIAKAIDEVQEEVEEFAKQIPKK